MAPATGRHKPPTAATNLPLLSLVAAIVLVVVGVVGLAIVDTDNLSSPPGVALLGLIVSSVPSLIAAAFSERTSRDIRNGVLQGKVTDALDDAGLVDVAQLALRTTPLTVEALARLTEALDAERQAEEARQAAQRASAAAEDAAARAAAAELLRRRLDDH